MQSAKIETLREMYDICEKQRKSSNALIGTHKKYVPKSDKLDEVETIEIWAHSIDRKDYIPDYFKQISSKEELDELKLDNEYYIIDGLVLRVKFKTKGYMHISDFVLANRDDEQKKI